MNQLEWYFSHVFLQRFFKSLKEETQIDLENIIYFRDNTHYFVMTAKKDSLLQRGVIKHDTNDRDTMLKSSNIDQEQLKKYGIDAAQVRQNKIPPEAITNLINILL